jgi:hypothetical protein
MITKIGHQPHAVKQFHELHIPPAEPSLRVLAAAVRKHPGQRSEDYARQTYPGFRASSFTTAVRLGLIDWTADEDGEFHYWPANGQEVAA